MSKKFKPFKPLMSRSKAVWLYKNTCLTYEQISAFTVLHILEVQAIADGEVASAVQGVDPILSGDLTLDEIKRCEEDSEARLRPVKHDVELERRSRGVRYTPLSIRQERPYAIAWLLKYHPSLSNSQIIKLVGTTKQTIESIRNKEHWICDNIRFVDPVVIGLCTQVELDSEVEKAAAKKGNKVANSEFSQDLDPSKNVPEDESSSFDLNMASNYFMEDNTGK